MSETISGASGPITLTGTDNPLTITSTGVVTATGAYDAIYGASGTLWTITNAGHVTASGNYAIDLAGAGDITNTGSISGAGGIEFGTGGFVTNGTAGLISGIGTTTSGVEVTSGLGTIENSGSITGGKIGVNLRDGGIVTNSLGGVLSGGNDAGVFGNGQAVTLANSGIIQGTVSGIDLEAGGSATNTASGQISGGSFGAFFEGAAGTLLNSGIVLSSGDGVVMGHGGVITNDVGASITGVSNAIYFKYRAAGTITNSGTISGTGASSAGVDLAGGGLVTNDAGGLISGSAFGVFVTGTSGAGVGTVVNTGTITASAGTGVDLVMGGTVTDAGTIVGGGGTAISFGGTISDLLDLERGYSLTGTVAGSGSLGATNILELGGSAGSPLTVNYETLHLTNFQDVRFGPGGNDTLQVSLTSGTLPATISGWTLTSDVVDLTAIGTNGTVSGLSNDLLTISGSSGTVTLKLDATDTISTFNVSSDGATGTDVSIACFCRGTRIRTETDEVPVEELAIGDKLVTQSGALRPIKWIGRRSYGGRFIQNNPNVLPILIKKGALGDDVPARDLCLSPHHALALEGSLVPAECLLNGSTVVQLTDLERVDYFHIELDSHDVIWADGAPAETFVDCDSRGMFHNANEFAQLYPGAIPISWQFCLPRLEDGVALERLRQRVAARAGITTPAQQAAAAPGRLAGHIDQVSHSGVAGWACDENHRLAPIALEVLVDGAVVASLYADHGRADLVEAGWGDGRHGFNLRFDPPLGAGPHSIALRRTSDGALLQGGAIDLAGDGAVERRAETADTRPFVLVIDERAPDPARDAGSCALLDHMRAMQRLGWRVGFVAQDGGPGRLALDALGIENYAAADYGGIPEVLRRYGSAADLVYLHRLSMIARYGALARQTCPRARLLYSVADLNWLRRERQARVAGRLDILTESRNLQRAERGAAAFADIVLTHSTAEAAWLRRHVPAEKVHVVPWSAIPQQRPVPWEKRSGFAFIAGWEHEPNSDAAEWLVAEVLPRLHQERGDTIRCLLVGYGQPRDPRRLAQRGVTFCGPVADLDAIFDMVRLTVAPLRYGAGVKGKVISSLAAGVPCAMTPIAAEGMELPRALGLSMAEDAEGLAAVIRRLHDDAAFNAEQAAAGLDYVAAQLAPDAIDARLAAALAAAVPYARAAS